MGILVNDRQRAKADALVLRYRAYARRVRKMLYLGGVLQDRTHPAVWSYVTGLLVILMCFSQCVLVMNFCRDHTDNLVLLSKCFGLTCSFITPVLMSACLLVKREKLIELHETLNNLFERELARDWKVRTKMLAALHTFDIPSYMLWFVLALTVVFYLCPSMIFVVRQIVRNTEPKIYRLPLPAKFPWPAPINGGPIFYLELLFQYSICWWMIFTIASVDSLFGFYAFQISSILRAMFVRLANPRPDEAFPVLLGTCIETHHRLQQCGHMLEDVWGLIIVRMFITNAILMCTLIFEARTFTELTINQIFSFISYMAIKLVQTFFYAWNGSHITSMSEHFRKGIYFSKWLDSGLNRHTRANIVLMMMQKPITIRALKMSSVNVNMFTNIVNTALSYFFLLQSLDEDR